MKRVKETGAIRWKKEGGGSFTAYIGGKKKMIKPGQVFVARLDEIPEAFRDTIVPVDGVELEVAKKAEDSVDVAKLTYTISPKGGNWFNVLDAEGKQVNEKSLRRLEAEELVRSLTE